MREGKGGHVRGVDVFRVVAGADAQAVRPEEDRMSQGRIAVALTGVVALLLTATWGFQLYSVPDPWAPYARAVREYLGAGLHRDSIALVRHSTGAQPVDWVHDAVRRQPATVAAWAQQLHAVTGFRDGETVTVALTASNVDCAHLNSVTARLLNHSAAPRLLAISSPCLRNDVPALLPYQRWW